MLPSENVRSDECTVRVHKLTGSGNRVEVLSSKETMELIRTAYSKGYVVIDKQKGLLIDTLSPEVREIVVVMLAAGG